VTDAQPTGRIAGIDYGTKRIGVAITDAGQTIASPLDNYDRCGPEGDARYFKRLVDQEQVVCFVVGLPIHLSGDESEKSREARRFAKWLREVTGLPVDLYDERFTTAHAESAMLDAGLTNKKRKKRRDMLAAQIMLASYLESKN
jgi:putative Holliday junction resolvase